MYFIFNIFDLSIIIFFFNIIFYYILSLLKSTRTGANFQHLIIYFNFFKLLQPLSVFSNLSISNLSNSSFKLAKSSFLQIVMHQHLVRFLCQVLSHSQINFYFALKVENNSFLYSSILFINPIINIK